MRFLNAFGDVCQYFPRGDLMKNVLFIICILTLALFLIKPNDGGEVLRLRVIANSDSVTDQSEKMRVVEAVDGLLDGENFDTLDAAERWIGDNFDKIENVCKDVWQGDFTAELCREKYDDGEYRSLVITLGEGNGHNFWGTLFPDIALGMSGAKPSKNKPFSVVSRNGDVIGIRFWIVEQILNIF